MLEDSILARVLEVLDEMKAEDVKVFEVAPTFPFADYFVIATALSKPHIKAIDDKIWEKMKEFVKGEDGGPESGWMIIDVAGIWIHLFLDEVRKQYALEDLWSSEWDKVKELQ